MNVLVTEAFIISLLLLISALFCYYKQWKELHRVGKRKHQPKMSLADYNKR